MDEWQFYQNMFMSCLFDTTEWFCGYWHLYSLDKEHEP